MTGFWNVKTLLEDGSQMQQNLRYLQLENVFSQYRLSILGISASRWARIIIIQVRQKHYLVTKYRLMIDHYIIDFLEPFLSS